MDIPKAKACKHYAVCKYRDDAVCPLECGYYYDETEKLVHLMRKTLKAQSRLLVAYRTGGKPPEWVFDTLQKARKSGLEI